MQVNTKIITNLLIKNHETNGFLAKYHKPNLPNLSDLKVLRSHPLLKTQNADTFSTSAFVEVHNMQKVQITESGLNGLSIKFTEEIPEHDSEVKLNQKILKYCKAVDDKSNAKLFTNVKQIFSNQKLEPSYNFYELLRNCQGKDEKLDLAKLELVNKIINNRKLHNGNHINTVLKTCLVDGTFNINSLKYVRELLTFKRINDSNDIFYIFSKTKTRTKEIDKKLFGLSKQLLNHPNIYNMLDTQDLLNICKTPENKINIKTTNLIMRMLSSKKLAQTESEKNHNSTVCLELFETCKDKASKMNKDLLKILENLFNCKQITDMRKTLKTMKIIQRTYNETSSKSYLKEVNTIIKKKTIQSQGNLLLSIESLSNERVTNKFAKLERNELKEAIEIKDKGLEQTDFNGFLGAQRN